MNTATVKTKGDIGFKKLTVDFSGELMKNRQAAEVVDPGHTLDVAEDSDGNPILFSIGNDGKFYVVFRDIESLTGWRKLDLSSYLGDDFTASAFGIYQAAATGRIMLATAGSAAGQKKNDQVYLSPYLPNTPSTWTDAVVAWKERSFDNGKMTVSGFAMGADSSGTASPLVLAEVNKDGQSKHYRVNAAYDNDAYSMQAFQLPENAIGNLLDLAIGQVEGRQGAYTLYKTTTGKSLSFTSLPFTPPHVQTPQRLNYTFDLPGDINAIEALPTTGNTDDLYGAGAGLFRWIGTSRTSELITDSPNSVSKLVARQDGEHIALWMVQGDENLLFVHGSRGAKPEWSIPLTLGTKVTQIAALRNGPRKTNELFTVTASSGLQYFYQDPVSTLWQETQIPLPTVKGSVEFDSYTTHIQLFKDGDVPLLDKEFQLTATELSYITVNHQLHIVSPTSPAIIKPDIQGDITIINKVGTISTPTFHLSADWLNGVIDINPGSNAQLKLNAVKSGADLKAVTLPDGAPLIKPGVDSTNVDSVGKAIGKMNSLKGPVPGSIRKLGSAPPNQILAANVDATGHFGIMTSAGRMQYVEGDSAAEMLDDWEDAIAGIAGDIFHSIEKGLEEIIDWAVKAVDGVAHFFIKLGKTAFKFVLDTVEKIDRAITAILKKIEVAFKDLIQWLGFLFNWDDIKRTHTALKSIVNNGFDYLIAGITLGEEQVKTFFDDLKTKIIGKDLAKQLGDQATVPISGMGKNNKKAKTASDPRTNYVNNHLKSPASLASGNLGTSPFDAGDFLKKLGESLVTFGKAEITTVENAITEISQNLNGSIEHDVTMILEILAAAFLQEVENGVIELMEVAKLFLQAIEGVLNAEWEIPVLSELYEFISGDPMSLLDLACLILAIPVTVAYKLVTDETPFTDTQTGLILKALKAPSSQPGLTAAVDTPKYSGGNPTKIEIEASFILGGICVSTGRAADLLIGLNLASDKKGNLGWRWFAAKTLISTLTYSSGVGNRVLAESVSGAKLQSFEGTLIRAQAVWPILDLLSIPASPADRKGLAYLKVFCGFVNFGSIVALFVEDMADDADAKERKNDVFKFLENIGMTVAQMSGPSVKLIKNPAAQEALLLTYAFAGITSSLTNLFRSTEAKSNGKMASPI